MENSNFKDWDSDDKAEFKEHQDLLREYTKSHTASWHDETKSMFADKIKETKERMEMIERRNKSRKAEEAKKGGNKNITNTVKLAFNKQTE